MSDVPSRRGLLWLVWLMVALTAAIISLLSAQPSSAAFTVLIFGEYNFIARKLAHFCEFAVLFCLLQVAVILTCRRCRFHWMALVCLVICVGYAAGDEIHQIFVPGRTPSIWDVAWDAAGAAFGYAVCSICKALCRQ